MDIRSLRYFLMTAREENITRAAENLHIAQPSLSRQLMELEAELGRPLLVRGKRKITLTEDGILLRKRAEEIIALLDKTEQEITADRTALRGEISLGGAPLKEILQAAAALRQKHPDVRFYFYSSDATGVTERLDHGSLDFAVLLEPIDTVKYEYLPLKNSAARWGLLMPADCTLAQKAGVQKEDLCAVPLIMHRRIGLQREIEHWAQTDMERMNIAAMYNIVTGDPAVFVQNGLGYFLTSDSQLPQNLDPALCFRPLDPPLTLSHALVWKRHAPLSRAAEAFLEQIQNHSQKGDSHAL